MSPEFISKQTARRFVLGRQGLWPGRRWRGKKGTARALRACEAVQLDPLQVVARSQDLVLHSRVLDYKPDYLQQVLYKDRQFFDYGGWLAVYPMSDLPYWRVHMGYRSKDKRVEDFVLDHEELFEQVRAELRARGPLGNQDLDGKAIGSWNYRGRKDSALAMFDMWLSGELMIHHRNGFNRVYDFRENIAPKEFDHVAGESEAQAFFARKNIAFHGLLREAGLRLALDSDIHRKHSREETGRLLAQWLGEGWISRVRIEGERETYLVLTQDLKDLEILENGKTPKAWKPIGTTTSEEVTFLAPLDIVSARGRAKKLFGFEYLWEVYKPVHQRRWGYYTLPILYGDDLVARLDPKLDRLTMTLQIKGYWNEEDAPLKEDAFLNALARGMIRFAEFLEARRVDLSGVRPLKLRTALKAVMKSQADLLIK